MILNKLDELPVVRLSGTRFGVQSHLLKLSRLVGSELLNRVVIILLGRGVL